MYYENEQLWMEHNYKNGKLEGIGKEYYENGKLKWEANYKNGKLVGLTKTYYESGVLRGEHNYKNGKKINRKAYTPRGKLEFDQDYPE